MQIVLRCGKCGKTSISEDKSDTCLEIDAQEMEIRFVCRECKKENRVPLEPASKHQVLPRIGRTRF